MFNPFRVGLVLVLVAGAGPLRAQLAGDRFGVGVSLDMTPTSGALLAGGATFDARPGNIHFPIQVSRSIRIEPTLGYAREKEESSLGTTSVSGYYRIWRLGVGVLLLMPRSAHFQAYIGGRVGIANQYQKQQFEDTSIPFAQSSTAKRSDKFLSTVFGGEFYFAPEFSLGGEAQITYTNYGDIDVSSTPPNPSPQPRSDGSRLETAGQIALRWYP